MGRMLVEHGLQSRIKLDAGTAARMLFALVRTPFSTFCNLFSIVHFSEWAVEARIEL